MSSRQLNIACMCNALLGGLGGVAGLYVSGKVFLAYAGKIQNYEWGLMEVIGSPQMWQWFIWCAIPFIILSVIAKLLLRNPDLNQRIYNKRLAGIISAFVLMQIVYVLYGCFIGSSGFGFVYGAIAFAPIIDIVVLPIGYFLGYAFACMYIIIQEGIP